MEKNKEKKKTLTIASNFKKKIDTSSFQKTQNKKSFSISKDKKILLDQKTLEVVIYHQKQT